jgi:hypothetical protein
MGTQSAMIFTESHRIVIASRSLSPRKRGAKQSTNMHGARWVDCFGRLAPSQRRPSGRHNLFTPPIIVFVTHITPDMPAVSYESSQATHASNPVADRDRYSAQIYAMGKVGEYKRR